MKLKSIDRQMAIVVGLAVLGLLIGVVGYLTVVKAQQAKMTTLDAQIATAQQQYAALHSEGSRKPALRTAELFQLSRAMPENDDMPGILVELSRLAAQSSVQIAGIAPSPRVPLSDGSSAVPLRVTIDGNWPQIAAFLKNLDQQVRVTHGTLSVAGRLFAVDAIQVSPGSAANSIEATLTMSAFDYGAPPSPTATAGGSSASTDTTSTTTTPSTSGSQQAVGAGSGS